jgi:hypothetical protein
MIYTYLYIYFYFSSFIAESKIHIKKKKTKGHFSVVRRSEEFSLPISSGTEDKYRGKN